ncbi:MAG: glutaredoxin family protein [Verrucomicrobiota bacterium]
MNIVAYLKPSCGWSRGVRAVFDKYSLEYEDRDIINDRRNFEEMVEKSGQRLSPCVVIDGVMLADVSGEEVENYMLSNRLVKENNVQTDGPLNRCCSDEEHGLAQTETIRFF